MSQLASVIIAVVVTFAVTMLFHTKIVAAEKSVSSEWQRAKLQAELDAEKLQHAVDLKFEQCKTEYQKLKAGIKHRLDELLA